MNYAEAMAYLAEAGRRGIVPGLDSIRDLLKYLDDPQKQLRFVHVAGTNGKGSTTAMTASIAAQAGYTVGRYTSPAVFDDREKYAVNGKWISEAEYASCMALVADAVDRMDSDGLTLPTAFEVETALAMIHFLRSGCDLVVLETGMGGAMDATNIVENTDVCILTAIGMDHMKFLGGTLAEIAAQKAGIIKPGCDVVLQKQSDVVTDTVADVCRACGAVLTLTEPQSIRLLQADADGQTFRYRGMTAHIALQGRFQLDNAAAAIEAALLLRKRGFAISDEAICSGLAQARWPGRLQKIADAPEVYIDGAHNPNAAVRLAEAIPLMWPDKRLICIMGVLADKDFSEVARLVCSQAQRVITVTPDNSRALDALSLCDAVRPYCPLTEAAENTADALQRAKGYAAADDVILAFGSLSYLKQITAAAKEL